MDVLCVVPDVLILEKKLDNFLTKLDVTGIGCRLLQPLFEKTSSNLGLALIQKAKERACLARNTGFNALLAWEDIQGFQRGDIES